MPDDIADECQRHKAKPKPACKSNWGSKLLAGHKISRIRNKQKCSPGQLTLWDQVNRQVNTTEELPKLWEEF
ncbi:hypothetical protein [Scytonema sp. PCC 10023]|uniref:hypothetical protein n=1 Tax=Scytonema sp. PCC 10023 TaxID=1680591 RepID=UPI0039C6E41D